MNDLQKLGRLAFRHEGDWWVAYSAQSGTMKDAVELSRVHMAFVQERERMDQFIQFVRDIYADVIERQIGIRPRFDDEPQPAPEHERAGNS